MHYFDAHTHLYRAPDAHYAGVVSLRHDDPWPPAGLCAVGIHPWDVDASWPERLQALALRLQEGRATAVGECGLDRLRGGTAAEQEACFRAQVELAERLRLPLVVHCVRAVDDVLRLTRGVERKMLHGFRGGPQQAEQLLRAGFWLSFGPLHQAESLRRAYDAGRMLLETDDSGLTIEAVYERAASVLNISATDLEVPGTTMFGAISAKG